MNLTEVLLAVIVSLAVIAGGYTLYTNVSDKNEVAQVMQNVSLLRANIEDAYDGNYENLSSDASDGSLYDLGILPERLARVSSGGTTPATKWGPITIEAGDDPSTYTISFSGLSKDICLHLGRFQYRSWAKVEAGGTAVWTRGTDTGLKTAELVQACKACYIASPEAVRNAIYASSRLLTLEKNARFFSTVYTAEDVHTFLAAYAAAAPAVYDQEADLGTGDPWCMPWLKGAMGAERGATPETLGRKAACMDYGELEALFGPDEEGLAAKTEAAVRGYLLHGNPIPEFLKPEEDILNKAAAEIAEARERVMDDEEAERLIHEIITGCIRDITPRVAMREGR